MKPHLLAAATFVLTASIASSWDVSGHIIIAKIAYDNTSPAAREKMGSLGKMLTFATPGKGDRPPLLHTYNGVNLAAWPDNVKHASAKQTPFAHHFNDWHFIDIGLEPTDPNPLKTPAKLTVAGGDAIQALQLCEKVLTHKVANSEFVPNEAVALALLCHLVGDIHQPLHCASHYYHPAPAHGKPHDGGGNAVKIANFDDEYPELHQFWDTAYKMSFDPLTQRAHGGADLSTFSINPNSPLLVKGAKEIVDANASHPIAPESADFAKWARESHKIAKEIAYGHLGSDYSDNEITVTEEYSTEAKKTAQRQIYVAGMRLATILKKIYP